MNPHTPDFVSDLYPLDPQKTAHLPHPSYQGLYPQSVTREEARAELGLPPTAKAVLFFGQMRRYKGLAAFFEAMSELHLQDENVVILLAGKTDDVDRAWIERTLPSSVPAVRDHRFIPDDEVQRWFAAADTAVLPYERVLNSGSVFLCATFGRSVVAPRTPELVAEFDDQPWLRFYDAHLVSGLAAAVRAALAERESDSSAARNFAAARSPYAFSRMFDALLRRFERPT
jgi:glycosyltransferase involved in cell wall biosynthesis